MLMPNGTVAQLWTPQGKRAKVRLSICCLSQVPQIQVNAMATFQPSSKTDERARVSKPNTHPLPHLSRDLAPRPDRDPRERPSSPQIQSGNPLHLFTRETRPEIPA